eukprot:759722-Hanusia_phi.AAC.3
MVEDDGHRRVRTEMAKSRTRICCFTFLSRQGDVELISQGSAAARARTRIVKEQKGQQSRERRRGEREAFQVKW